MPKHIFDGKYFCREIWELLRETLSDNDSNSQREAETRKGESHSDI